jgi:hypothetical protein
MPGFLTEVAIQLKATLSFALGLGAMFTVAKALFTNLFVMPGIPRRDTAAGLDIDRLQRRLLVLAVLSTVFFVAALAIYFRGPLADLNVDALQKGSIALTAEQGWHIGLLIFIAAALVIVEALGSIWKYRLSLVASRS